VPFSKFFAPVRTLFLISLFLASRSIN
jgi:hypothetical protein